MHKANCTLRITFAVSPYLVGQIEVTNPAIDRSGYFRFKPTSASWNNPDDPYVRLEPFEELPAVSVIEVIYLQTGEIVADFIEQLAEERITYGLPVGDFANRLRAANILEATQLLRYFAKKVRPANKARDLAPLVKFVSQHLQVAPTPDLERSIKNFPTADESVFLDRIKVVMQHPVRNSCIDTATKILHGTGRRPVAHELETYFSRIFN